MSGIQKTKMTGTEKKGEKAERRFGEQKGGEKKKAEKTRVFNYRVLRRQQMDCIFICTLSIAGFLRFACNVFSPFQVLGIKRLLLFYFFLQSCDQSIASTSRMIKGKRERQSPRLVHVDGKAWTRFSVYRTFKNTAFTF